MKTWQRVSSNNIYLQITPTQKNFTLQLICREGKNKDTLWLLSMYSRVMTWQPHCLSDALSLLPKGRYESEHTQVELVWNEHAVNRQNSKLFSFQVILVIFISYDFIENKRTSSKLLILCVVIFNKCKIKHVNIASINPRLEATRILTSAYI